MVYRDDYLEFTGMTLKFTWMTIYGLLEWLFRVYLDDYLEFTWMNI